MMAAATGHLETHPAPVWSSDAAVTVVIAAQGYPESPRMGDVIAGLGDAAASAGVDILHAGTRVQDDGSIAASGGRVLSVTAVGDTLHQARDRAYTAVDLISLEGSHHRRDIALAAANQE
jgi:phosphoribosylamine--glycine ligase